MDRIIESGHNTSGYAVVGDKRTVVEGQTEGGMVGCIGRRVYILQVTTVTVLHALNCIYVVSL